MVSSTPPGAPRAQAASVRVFVPVGAAPAATPAGARAARRAGASPAVVGLLDNHKHNSARVLVRIEQRLRERHPELRVLRVRKPEAGKGAPRALLESLAAECEAVVNGIGD